MSCHPHNFKGLITHIKCLILKCAFIAYTVTKLLSSLLPYRIQRGVSAMLQCLVCTIGKHGPPLSVIASLTGKHLIELGTGYQSY